MEESVKLRMGELSFVSKVTDNWTAKRPVINWSYANFLVINDRKAFKRLTMNEDTKIFTWKKAEKR